MLAVSSVDLAILRAVAQRGSFTAAAGELGYTQSAISKRVGALETAAGRRLFARERTGVVLTPAAAVLDALDAMERDLQDDAQRGRPGPVRVGAFASALAGIVPAALALL